MNIIIFLIIYSFFFSLALSNPVADVSLLSEWVVPLSNDVTRGSLYRRSLRYISTTHCASSASRKNFVIVFDAGLGELTLDALKNIQNATIISYVPHDPSLSVLVKMTVAGASYPNLSPYLPRLHLASTWEELIKPFQQGGSAAAPPQPACAIILDVIPKHALLTSILLKALSGLFFGGFVSRSKTAIVPERLDWGAALLSAPQIRQLTRLEPGDGGEDDDGLRTGDSEGERGGLPRQREEGVLLLSGDGEASLPMDGKPRLGGRPTLASGGPLLGFYRILQEAAFPDATAAVIGERGGSMHGPTPAVAASSVVMAARASHAFSEAWWVEHRRLSVHELRLDARGGSPWPNACGGGGSGGADDDDDDVVVDINDGNGDDSGDRSSSSSSRRRKRKASRSRTASSKATSSSSVNILFSSCASSSFTSSSPSSSVLVGESSKEQKERVGPPPPPPLSSTPTDEFRSASDATQASAATPTPPLFAQASFIDLARLGAEFGGKPRPGTEKTGAPIFVTLLNLTKHSHPSAPLDALAIWPLLQFRVGAAHAPTGAALLPYSGGLGMTPLELAFPHMADIVIPLLPPESTEEGARAGSGQIRVQLDDRFILSASRVEAGAVAAAAASNGGSQASSNTLGTATAAAGKKETKTSPFPAWHISMLNDDVRNRAYAAGIKAAINLEREKSPPSNGVDLSREAKQRGHPHILELGAGAGFLSLVSSRFGAGKVTAIEADEAMIVRLKAVAKAAAAAAAAEAAVAAAEASVVVTETTTPEDLRLSGNFGELNHSNNGTHTALGTSALIQIIPHHSTFAQLCLSKRSGVDAFETSSEPPSPSCPLGASHTASMTGGPADIIVHEIFDFTLTGEGVLPSLYDAQQRLARRPPHPPPILVPAGATMYGAIVESASLRHQFTASQGIWGGARALPHTSIAHPVLLQSLEHRLLTSPQPLYALNFSNIPEPLRRPRGQATQEQISSPPPFGPPLRIPLLRSGTADALVSWFSLDFQGAGGLATGPSNMSWVMGQHWYQSAEMLEYPRSVGKGGWAVLQPTVSVGAGGYPAVRMQIQFEGE